MARRKAAKNCAVLPWASAKPDCREPKFIQLGVSLFESAAFQALTPAQRILYLCMIQDASGHQEFEFSKARFARYGFSSSTARAGIEALIEAGFISRDYSGKIAREANRYRFSLAWKLDKPL